MFVCPFGKIWVAHTEVGYTFAVVVTEGTVFLVVTDL